MVEADQRARLAEPCIRGLEILVVGGHLRLQRIQLGIAEDLPPLAARSRIGGLGHLPVGVLLVARRGSLPYMSGAMGTDGFTYFGPTMQPLNAKRGSTG